MVRKNPRPYQSLGLRIRSGRDRLGLTQSELAERVGVSRLTIVRWETGAMPPSNGKVEQLASTLGTAPKVFSPFW